MSQKEGFAEIMDRYIKGTLSSEEKEAFFRMFTREKLDPELEEYLWQNYLENSDIRIWPEEFRTLFADRLASKILSTEVTQPKIVHRVHFLRTAWFRYAAAIVVCFGIAAYFWTTNYKNDHLATTVNHRPLQPDVAPGGEKAVLTLADGTKIILDNAANGNLALQGGTEVVKLANGQVAYNVKGLSAEDIMWNTMSTPAGGQYRLVLPDGTKVWLNAASSITYPAAFVSQNREVKIIGEAYFEVVKNKERPFIVDINGKSTVEVLGTSFNINSYTNEENIKTTLLEGSVKISSSIILKPGEQAVEASGETIVVQSADINQALAWKNGLFSFDNADLRSVMRQLERWYDIEVKYVGSVADFKLKGEMYRDVNLSVVLTFLQKMGLKFRMDAKTLTVYG
ncbi:MAG: FecR domain-containing protein [Chitinophagaceae bacterium]|nr:FecR domain-containing protein [Chitinophagaceae bacterium]